MDIFFIEYWPNGNKRFEKMMKEGKSHGLCKEYSENGSLIKTSVFCMGEECNLESISDNCVLFENGFQMEYDSDGVLLFSGFVENGVRVFGFTPTKMGDFTYSHS